MTSNTDTGWMEAIEQNMEQLLELLRQSEQQMKRNNQVLLEIKHAMEGERDDQ